MKTFKRVTLAGVIIALSAIIPSFANSSHQESQASMSRTSMSNEMLQRFQALSKELAAAAPEDRVGIARATAPGIGATFLEPNSVGGRRLINYVVAKKLVRIYASDLSDEEKLRQAQEWAADAGATLRVERAGEYRLPPRGQVRKFSKKAKERALLHLMSGDCQGWCANFSILQGSGCVVTCQEWFCPGDYSYYSEVMLICEIGFTDFGPEPWGVCQCA